MKKEVRRSKRELAAERNAVARLTRKNHKAAAKARATVVRDFDFLFDEPGLPNAGDLTETIDALISRFREGAGGPDSHDLLIFDPALDDLTKLPIGVLDHKELPLLKAVVPERYDDLLAHCERMIVRSRKPDIIAYVVAGWPGCDADRSAIRRAVPGAAERAIAFLARHVRALWQLSGASRALYEAIVCGRHGTALRLLRTARLPGGMAVASVRRLIQRHGLLWCANDLQMIVARGAIGARNPLGLLASTTQVEVKPEGIANDLKRHLLLLRLALDLYATTTEQNDPIEPKSAGEVPEDDEVAQFLKRRAEQSAARTGTDLLAFRLKLDDLIVRIRGLRTYGPREWWEILERPVTANELSAHFSGFWFSGLSHVQVAAVTVLRYLQAEVWIERLVAERTPPPYHMPPRAQPAMPPVRRGRNNARLARRGEGPALPVPPRDPARQNGAHAGAGAVRAQEEHGITAD